MKMNNALKWAENLEESGMPSAQAREVAQIFHESHETLMENMREMFAAHERILDIKLESLETKLDGKLDGMATKADVKEEINRLTRFTAILWLSVVGLTVALRFFG